MKKFLLASVCACIAFNAGAQRIISGDNIEEKQIAIDKVLYRITYQTQSVNNTENVDSTGAYLYGKDEMRLDVGDKVSKFYSYTNFRRDSLMKENFKRGDFSAKGIGKSGNLKWVLYKNYPEGKTVVFDDIFGDNFRIEENSEQPTWDIVQDSTAAILGYPCQMARTTFKGRTWTAWYTEDIPLDNGPWKLCGLPGLILRAHDAERQFIFNGTGMQPMNGKNVGITYNVDYDKYEKTDMKEFVEIRRKSTPLGSLEAQGIKIKFDNDMVDVNGKETSMKKLLNERTPYNPIER